MGQRVDKIFYDEDDMGKSFGYTESDRHCLAFVQSTGKYYRLANPTTGRWELSSGSVGNQILAIPHTTAGIQAAVDTIYNSGQPGEVVFAVADYDLLLGGVNWRSNVHAKGIPFLKQATGDIPDSDMQVIKGTRFINGPGVTSINFNTVDQPTLPPVGTLSATGLYNCKFEGLTSIGGNGLIKLGAQNTLGAIDCYFNDLYYFDATGWGMEFHNFMQCTFGNLRGRNSIKGGGMRYAVTLGSRTPGTAVLIPGNSTWVGTSFIFNSHVSGRGYEWYGRTTTDANQLNELHAEGAKFQMNRFIGGATPPSITLAVTAGNPDINVPSQAEYDLLIETGALSLIASAPGSMGTTDTYFIVSKDDVNRNIRLQTSILPNSFVTPSSGSGNYVASYGGPPGMCVNFDTLSLLTSSHIGNYDIELTNNICSFYGRRIRSTVFSIAEMYNTYHRGALVFRDSVCKIKAKTTNAIGYCNFDGNCHIELENEVAATKVLTGPYTLTKIDHGNTYIVNSASEVAITYPTGLNPRFWVKVIQKGAGKAAPTASGTTNNTANSKTAGVGAEILIRATHGQVDQFDVFGMTGP